jgi:rhodanese-related sulfurtransferase
MVHFDTAGESESVAQSSCSFQSIALLVLTYPTLRTTMKMPSTEGSSAVRNRRRKNNSGGNGTPTKQEELERQVQFYQEKTWPHIPRMTPHELVALQEEHKQLDNDSKVLLIDVRTAAERAVSVIPGSVPLQQVSKRGSNSESTETVQLLLRQDTTVVTYCTIGYRSGMEATRLLHRYPSLEGRIYNLDGIVAYTYLNSDKESSDTHDESSPLPPVSVPATPAATTISDPQQEQNQNQRQRGLVDPVTNKSVFTVHTFGSMWSLADPVYTASHFSTPQLAVRLGQVGGRVVIRFFQRVAHYTVQSSLWCGCFKEKAR